MKVKIICSSCASDFLANPIAENDARHGVEVFTSFQDSALYEVSCPNGHLIKTVVQNPKHELLFESGIHALKGGYYREAVSSFAVSLERFYEYSIRIMLGHLMNEASITHFERTWKAISKQSERQIGGFYMLYLNLNRSAPPLFDAGLLKSHKLHLSIEGNDPVKFRNKVIHEGYVPSYEQALFFGEAVNLYIKDLLVEYLRSPDIYDITAVSFEYVSKARLDRTHEVPIAVQHNPTFISFIDNGQGPKGRSLISYIEKEHK